jgi:hypothetical protein
MSLPEDGDGVFVWAFGRISQDERASLSPHPTLVQCLPVGSVDVLASGFRRTIVASHSGELFSWGSVMPSSGDDRRDSSRLSASLKFQRVHLPGAFFRNDFSYLHCPRTDWQTDWLTG